MTEKQGLEEKLANIQPESTNDLTDQINEQLERSEEKADSEKPEITEAPDVEEPAEDPY